MDINYSFIAYEIFCLGIYNFHYTDIVKSKIKYSVFDIGANRGYSTLFFAEKEWCKNVFGFEIIPETNSQAIENINMNPNYLSKINLSNYGLGSKNGNVTVQYLPFRDGISSMIPEFLQNYAPKVKPVTKYVEIRKASETLRQLINDNNVTDIIIKIDVEGAEYQIFNDLIEFYPEIFNKIKMIIGDTHLGFDIFYDRLKPFGYEVIWTEPHDNGTCPFEMIKKE